MVVGARERGSQQRLGILHSVTRQVFVAVAVEIVVVELLVNIERIGAMRSNHDSARRNLCCRLFPVVVVPTLVFFGSVGVVRIFARSTAFKIFINSQSMDSESRSLKL